jgi:hypothetical protein
MEACRSSAIACRAVVTTSASSNIISDAVDVSASTQRCLSVRVIGDALSKWRDVGVCPHELRDFPVALPRVIQPPMGRLSEPGGLPSGQAPPPCARGEARMVEGGGPEEALAGRRRRSGS